ncbi:hypothetical protein PAXRUDRAFT_114952, partial [Paxillus rubicundulus Ve08.2h10]
DGLPGKEIIDECKILEERQKNAKKPVGPLTNWEIDKIQAHLCTIKWPTWNQGPPINLGDAEHGKLKAEQQQSMVEFDLPVVLCKLWEAGSPSPKDDKMSSQRKRLAHSTMLLAMVIQWGTSHVTSEYHMYQYKQYMKVYLKCVKTIFPEIGWQPNHHASFHLYKFLHRYGPMHGWWMFPFERAIGSLQKTNTNHKIGQLEQTMLGAFCTAARVKVLLQHPDAPKVVRDVSNMLKVCCSASDDRTLAADISIFHTLT